MADTYVKYKSLVWIVLVLVALNLFTLGLVWFGKPSGEDKFPPRHPPPPEHVRGFFRNEIGWNEEQDRRFEAIRGKFFDESHVLIDSIQTMRKELFESIFSGPGSGKNPDSLAMKIGQLQIRVDVMRFNHFKEIEMICDTDEQKEKFKKILMEVFVPAPTPENRGPGFRPFK